MRHDIVGSLVCAESNLKHFLLHPSSLHVIFTILVSLLDVSNDRLRHVI
jgi:hypothetical protein